MAQHNQKRKRLEEITQKREQSTHKTRLCSDVNRKIRELQKKEVCLEKGDNKNLKSKNTVRKLVGALVDQHVKSTFTDDEARAAKTMNFLHQA